VVAVVAAVIAAGAGIGVVFVAGPNRVTGAPRPGPSAPTVAAPRLVLRLPTTITVRGHKPHLAWPVSGQAAVTIPGIGSMGTSGPVRTPQPIASLAKVMTSYVILADHPLTPGQPGPALTVTAAEAGAYQAELAANESLIPVRAGERLTERQALEALLLPSADNIAQILARWDAGSRASFVRKMNAAATRLGMRHTRYTDPSGYAPSTVSTAPDQVKLAEAAMRDTVFAAIVAESAATVPVAGLVHNRNTLLGTDGMVGIKTGSATYSGGCLLFAAVRRIASRKVTLYGTVLGQPGDLTTLLPNVMATSQRLIATAENALTSDTVVTTGQTVAEMIQPGRPARRLTSPRDLTVIGWPGLSFDLGVTAKAGRIALTLTRSGTRGDKPITVALTPRPPR
jgi:serine-type D-Ala-D-Ala carboxypeptidase (penicillin-binding protein 5/6)